MVRPGQELERGSADRGHPETPDHRIGVTTITVRWESAPRDPSSVRYYVDDSPVGDDDRGFDRVLELTRSRDADVTLRIRQGTLGGGDLTDSFPFKHRMKELQDGLGKRKLIFEFS
jgi:hypothetical protein